MVTTVAAPAAFSVFADLLQREAGVHLPREKAYLLSTRLAGVMRREDVCSLDALSARLPGRSDLRGDVVEALLNHETYFFRDAIPFRHLEHEYLPRLHERKMRSKRLRIWCAACASGQEPLSLAILFARSPARWRDWDVEIHATDISQAVIDKAASGLFTQFEVQRGLPTPLLLDHFTQEGDKWRVHREIAERVTFRRHDLLSSSPVRNVDLVLARNVMLYFRPAERERALRNLAAAAAPDAGLMLGAAETIFNDASGFEPDPDSRGFYRRVTS
ncbi:MAG: protein-glutamate O-methyltransferase CheR [Pacificimonas sp.]